MSSNEQLNAGSIIFGAYIIGAWIAFFYYSWEYAQNHGFMQWLFLGDFIAAGKALIWPIMIFFG
jgi:hypothetical protein